MKRQEFQERLKSKQPYQIVYVDEAGIDNRQDYPYGYSEVGKRFYAAVFCGGIIPPQTNLLKSGKRTERVSWIAALIEGNLVAPMTDDTVPATAAYLRCG